MNDDATGDDPPCRADGGRSGSRPRIVEGAESAAAAALAIDLSVDAVPTIDARALYDATSAGERVTLLDVRGEDEVAAWRIEGPTVEFANVPAGAFVDAHPDADRVRDLVGDLDGRPVVVACPRGRASRHVAAVLREAGVEAASLDDGMRGWASVYVSHELGRTGGGLRIRQYDRPSSGCLSYLVHDGEAAVVVDPLRAVVDRYLADADRLGLDIVAAVDTHVHADHVSGLRDLAAAADAAAVVPEGALDRGLAFPDRVQTVTGGDEIPVGGTTLTAVALPGHTTEMTGLLADEVLLAGDSLFLDSVARPDLEAGADGTPALARQLHRTLHETLPTLPAETHLAPGHHGPRTPTADDGSYVAGVESVRERLSILDLDEAAFVDRVVADRSPRPANYGDIIAVNLGHEDATSARAFTLELGPNNCAATPAEPTDD